MENSPHKETRELSGNEMARIEGGLLKSIAAGLIVHVGLEAYNDWGMHRAAFDQGRMARMTR